MSIFIGRGTRRTTRLPRPGAIVLWLGALLMLFPTLWMIVSAFKTPQELIEYPPRWLPASWTVDSIVYVWVERNFSRMMFNSVFVSTVVTLLTVLTSAWIGYVFRMFEFRAKRVLFALVLATMMIPLPVLLIPHFRIVLALDWVNTYAALIAPFAVSAFGIFLMYQFLEDFPRELLEAARIEGVAEWRIFWHIVLPLTRAPCMALGVITFLHQWESLLWPIVAANSPSMQTLPLGLATFSGSAVETAALYNPYAAALVAAAPLLIVFPFLQKRIVGGIAFSGMK